MSGTETSAQQAPDPAPVFREGFCDEDKRPLVLWATILASAMGFIDGAVVPIALPSIRLSLDTSLAQAQWFSTAYFLTLASFNLLGGALGDRFGLGRLLRAALLFFVMASLGCAFASSAMDLIVMRALQGLGAAVLTAGSLATLSRAYPKEERGAAIGLWAAASAGATAIGPIAGGLALTYGGDEVWRWIFAINLPFGLVSFYLLRRADLSDDARSGARLDWLGAALITLGLLLLTWGLGADAGEGRVNLGVLGLSAFVILAFMFQQRLAKAPILPLRLFAARAFRVANLFSLVFYGMITSVFFFLPVLLIDVWREPAINVSAVFAPLAIFMGALSGPVGRLSDRIGPRPLLAIGALSIGFGALGLALATPSYAIWSQILPAMTLFGIGMALAVGPLSATVMKSIDDDLSGTASGANNTVSRVGGMLAIAGLTTVTTVVYRAAGGQKAFGATSEDIKHISASFVTFQTLCFIASALAIVAALVAWIGLPSRQKAKTT
ncbi:MAG: MFS transporter [Marinovum sp.]|nr:MFS transporter [Marinovum sp.]